MSVGMMAKNADWLCERCGAHVPAGMGHACPVRIDNPVIISGPEVSDEPGDLRAQQARSYYYALPIRLAREEAGGPIVSMHCTMGHHGGCIGLTQFRGKLSPCDCSRCEHQEAA